MELVGRFHLALHAAAQEVDFSIEALFAELLLQFEGLGLGRIAEGDGYGVFDSISRCLQFDGLAALPLDSEISLCMAQRTGSWNPVVDAFCLAVQESMAAGI